jgi:hypothetical protein
MLLLGDACGLFPLSMLEANCPTRLLLFDGFPPPDPWVNMFKAMV